mgnify:FL=1
MSNLAKAAETTFQLAVQGADRVVDTIRTNLGDTATLNPAFFEKIKIPAGGGVTWEIPTLSGDVESVREIVGIILAKQPMRAYYVDRDSAIGEPPACYSSDLVTGRGDPYGTGEVGNHRCATCKRNEWGSSTRGGKGKACAERRVLYVLRPEELIPVRISTPPGSLKDLDQFLIRLTSKNVPYYKVIVGLSLEKVSKDGNTYSKIKPRMIELASEELAREAEKYHRYLDAMLVGTPVADDYEEE